MPNKLSIVWFSRIEDYQALDCSIKSCISILDDNADYFVYVDDEEPVYLDIPGVTFLTSNFDQSKETGGINRIKGELEAFNDVFNKTGNRYLLKIDSDTLCVNDVFFKWLTTDHDLFGHKAVYNKHPYAYGGAYVIDCLGFKFESKNHLEKLDGLHSGKLSLKKWSEDFTMSCLSSSIFLTDDKDKQKWMSFLDYNNDLEPIIYAIENKVPLSKLHGNCSFMNCGYGFHSTQMRDQVLQLLLIHLLL